MFFRRHVQKAIPTNNSTVSSSIPINLHTINLAEDEHESTENELSTTPTALSPIEKTVNFSNEIDFTSTTEHLSQKHPGLLRLFDSTVCTVSIIISYLFSSKEPTVQQFLGKKLFDYPQDELDFYLPQLINMYIHIQSISNVIHDYITIRCSQSVDFSLQCAWLLDAYIADQMKTATKRNAAVKLLFDILYEKYKPKIIYTPTTINNLSNHNHRLDEEENENVINQDDEMKSERALSQDNLMLQINKKKGHQKSRSDVSGIIPSKRLSFSLNI
jgi:phosphatidylinositol 4-kinase